MTRDCLKCGCAIPVERLEVIPDTETCVNCSNVSAMIGFMIPTANKGCAPEIHMVSSTDSEAVRLAKRVHHRSR